MHRICHRTVVSALVCSATLFSTAAEPLSLKLTVKETTGSGGTCFVTTGVPLLPGQAGDGKRLRVLDDKGRDVLAQFRPLARWWRGDGSLRWVLVDFPAKLRAYQTKTFLLEADRTDPYESPLAVKEDDDRITIVTGPAEFVINRKAFNLFDRVRIDRNGDGKFAADEECVSPGHCAGSVVEDTYGRLYTAAAGTRDVRVEESGAVRVCVVAKGAHRAPDGKGYSRGMYRYDTRLHFYANSSAVRVDHVLNNCFPEPIGTPTFEDHSLLLKLNFKGEVSHNPEMKDKGAFVMYAAYGVGPRQDGLEEGQSLCMVQDSNGAETWREAPGYTGVKSADLVSFRGYRIYQKEKGKETVVDAGDNARGVMEFHGERFGLVIVPRHFWQQFPKALEVGYDGTARIGIFPREYKAPHWLQDAAGGGLECWLYFYGRQLKGGARPQFPRDGQTRSQWWQLLRDRPWPHVVADTLLPVRVALCPPEQYAACGALSDSGPYAPIAGGTPYPLEITERRFFTSEYLKGNGYGWQVFGTRWEECAGHSPWNYEPIGSSDYLFRYIHTRHPSWLEAGRRRNMQFRNIRAYKVDDDNRFRFSSWEEARANMECEGWCSRAKSLPQDPEAKKYQQGLWKRSSWELPNPAHNNLDELYDLYCLFGDTRALEGMRSVAGVGGAYAAFRGMHIHRATGWCLRSLLRYYELTGDEQALPVVSRAVDNCWKMVAEKGYRHVPRIEYKNTWFYNVFGRAVILAYQTTGDERMRDLAIGMTQGRASKSSHPALNSFAYDQTGQTKYLSEVPEKYIKVGGYFPACDAYRWMKPRPDKEPPASVKDLKAVAQNGNISLTWTAPGDDGRKGRAAVYQVKWSDLPVVEIAKDKEHCSFWAAENVPGEPQPAAAGRKEHFEVDGLRPGVYFVVLKTRDELNNESPLGNVVRVELQ